MGAKFKRWLIVAVLVVDGIGLATFGWIRMSRLEALSSRGITADGKVIDHSTSQYSKRSPSYSLTVEFTPTNSATMTRALDVDGNTYHSAVKEGSVKVRYLPDDPSRCSAGQLAILPYQVVLVLGLGMVGSGLLVLGWSVARAGF